MSKKKARTVIAPAVYDLAAGVEEKGGKLRFEKQILPLQTIDYTAKNGERRQLTFDEKYLKNLELAFAEHALDQVPFVLADADNRHTMDPERVRGVVTGVRVITEGEKPGLYGTIEFSNNEQARAVLLNPDLGVSARIRENVLTSSGGKFPAALIHVLGTMDPQVTGMGSWTPVDLSGYTDNVLDLSKETDVPKTKTDEQQKPVVKKALEDYTDADIDAMNEAELDAWLAEFAPDVLAEFNTQDEPEDETDVPEAEAVDAELQGASLSNQAEDVKLANEQAAFERDRANGFAKKYGEQRWATERNELEAAGVPAYLLDLATPVMSRAEDTVIDLSNEDADDLNVSDIVRGLLNGLKGAVDLAAEAGYELQFSNETDTADDPDAALLDAWNTQHPIN